MIVPKWFRRLASATRMVVLVPLISSGCYLAPVMPPSSIFYTNTQAPLTTEFKDGKEISTKRGESSTITILGLVSYGDASLRAAAKNGGIQRVHAADYKYRNILGFIYQDFTVIVYGD